MSKSDEEDVFWSENPNILLTSTDFFPLENMTLNQKLNALTRTIIVVSGIIFICFRNYNIIIASILTLFMMYLINFHKYKKEGFSEKTDKKSPALDYLIKNNLPISEDTFQKPSSKNPLSNVLLTDYSKAQEKKPAPPISNPNTKNDIFNQAKKLVQEANPDQPDISDKLFKDLSEKLNFEQSLRPFSSNPSTTIPNDQGAFADFCYGSMTSCKEGNLFACARNLSNHQNPT
jgi:hypothetical protein